MRCSMAGAVAAQVVAGDLRACGDVVAGEWPWVSALGEAAHAAVARDGRRRRRAGLRQLLALTDAAENDSDVGAAEAVATPKCRPSSTSAPDPGRARTCADDPPPGLRRSTVAGGPGPAERLHPRTWRRSAAHPFGRGGFPARAVGSTPTRAVLGAPALPGADRHAAGGARVGVGVHAD